MSGDLDILEKGDWFLATTEPDGYPINYRLVLSYALRNYLTMLSDARFKKGSSVLEALHHGLKDEEHYHQEHFIELIPFIPMNNDRGFVVVDQSHGIYPLVLYPEADTTRHKRERVGAFRRSLEDVIDKYADIYDYFNENKRESWTEQFQEDFHTNAGFTYQDNHHRWANAIGV